MADAIQPSSDMRATALAVAYGITHVHRSNVDMTKVEHIKEHAALVREVADKLANIQKPRDGA